MIGENGLQGLSRKKTKTDQGLMWYIHRESIPERWTDDREPSTSDLDSSGRSDNSIIPFELGNIYSSVFSASKFLCHLQLSTLSQ